MSSDGGELKVPLKLSNELEALESQALANVHLPDLASETTPLLQEALSNPSEALLEVTNIDPKKLAEERGKKIILWLTGPLLAYVPDVEQYGDEPDESQSMMTKILIEMFILAKYAVPLLL